MLARNHSQEKLPLLQDDALPQEQAINHLASMPLDVLAMIVKYFSFEDAISFMLTHKRAFSLFDHKVRMQNYARQIRCSEGGITTVSYLDVNYLLLRSHFHKKQYKQIVLSFPARFEEGAASARKISIGLGLLVGGIVTSVISLPAPIVACMVGSSGCSGTKMLIGTSVLGALFGCGSGARVGVERYESEISAIHIQQHGIVRKVSVSLDVQSLQNKSVMQLNSLFKANDRQRQKQQELIAANAAGNPRRITME